MREPEAEMKDCKGAAEQQLVTGKQMWRWKR
jgi:hypothetical protein